jgi:DNA mismatch repair protein MutS
LEETDRRSPVHALIDDLPLFSATYQSAPAAPDPLAELVDAIDPDDLTPRQALEALYKIKAARKSGGSNG